MSFRLHRHRTSFKRRAGAAVLVAAIHVGAVGLLLIAGYRPPIVAEQAPVEVAFIDGTQLLPQPEQIKPQLDTPRPIDLTVPLVNLPPDTPAATAITVAALQEPAPAVAVPAAGETPVVVTAVDYLKPPQPRYPPLAKRARAQGLVLLKVLIDTDGRARQVTVQRSSGREDLDDAAREAVLAALFRPYSENGVARRAIATVPIEFAFTLRTASR